MRRNEWALRAARLGLIVGLLAGTGCGGSSSPADARGDAGLPGDAVRGSDGAPLDVVPPGDAVARPGETARSDLERDTNPDVAAADLETLEAGQRAFALEFYRQVAGAASGNVFVSPYSLSMALAMTWAGARGDTEAQMASTLHFDLPQEAFHPAMNALDLELASREATATQNDATFSLRVANALWGQSGWDFLDDFLDVLALNYGAGMQLLDFAADPEAARQAINAWVEERTEGKIKNLLPQGSVDESTRLVLTNAIYFLAQWAQAFDEAQTHDGVFHRLDGTEVTASMMHGTIPGSYAEGDGFEAVRLPYAGVPLSMWIVVPDAGQFEAVESAWDASAFDALRASWGSFDLVLTMPKFSFTWGDGLVDDFQAMGMLAPFDPGQADFSGMDGRKDLFITGIFHKAFIAVDEKGTEAAAATAVVVGETSVPPSVEVVVDRPFFFFIVDEPTATILFEGRVVDPTQ